MVTIASLWLPILLSAVLVFVVSSIIHMLLPYHKSDFGKIPNEDQAMDALREFNIPPGDYVMPCAGSSQEMKSPDFVEKTKKGPIIFMTVLPSGSFAMGKSLALWFLYSVVVSVFAAYITSRAVEAGAEYLTVFRFAGATAFFCYAIALWQNSIWYKRAWSSTLKNTFDGFVYGLCTAGTFAWLWPS
ncbi:MAG: hypothetical protein JSW50_06520 [Candidatus Latescibacterota bacterium]|nr:MAG: hypothetical protein JSW50_06520 [Candidatus Latescibacterota bacterium]